MTYVPRLINVVIQLGTGNFGSSGQNTLTLSGLRVAATLSNVLMPGATTAVIQVYGMTPSQINQLSTAGLLYQNRKNIVEVLAGDAVNGMTAVFKGYAIEAYPDFTAAPDTAFVLSAVTTGDLQLKPIAPASFQGSTDVATVMGQMAVAGGLSLENNGVSVRLSNPYFCGTLSQQIYSCARAANIFAYVDTTSNTLVITPKTGSRNGGPIMVSAATGMIGYPVFQRNLIVVRSLLNPTIKQLGKIQIQSQLTTANGIWTVNQIDYNLSSLEPDGPWEMTMTAISANAPG